MNRNSTLNKPLGLVIGLASILTPATAQTPPAPAAGAPGRGAQSAAQTTQQIKPGFYVIAGAGGNTGVRVTSEGLIVVDTKNLGDPFYTALAEQIKTISTAPVKYVIITHHHQDHSGNSQKFIDAGAQVIAQENLKTNLATYAPAQGKPGVPNVTYDKEKTVKLGGASAEIYHYGPAHTSGDSIVYFPDLKIVQTGDVVVGVAPNIDFPFGGSAVGWVKVLDSIGKLDFDTLIPGHSAPNSLTLSRADFLAYKTKFETLVSRAKEAVKSGVAKDQLLATVKTDDLGWNINTPQWSQPARLDAFYAELQAAK